jgi:hypothetical protein
MVEIPSQGSSSYVRFAPLQASRAPIVASREQRRSRGKCDDKSRWRLSRAPRHGERCAHFGQIVQKMGMLIIGFHRSGDL